MDMDTAVATDAAVAERVAKDDAARHPDMAAGPRHESLLDADDIAPGSVGAADVADEELVAMDDTVYHTRLQNLCSDLEHAHPADKEQDRVADIGDDAECTRLQADAEDNGAEPMHLCAHSPKATATETTTPPSASGSGNLRVSIGGETSPGSSSEGGGNYLSSPQSTALILDIYDMWCGWLDNPEESDQLEQMLQMLKQGGEPFRSFIQFIARMSEPHRSAGMDSDECNQAAEDEANWRSCTAMRVACHAFTSPSTTSSVDGVYILSSIFSQLLSGLHPRSRAATMHISIVLQHILSAHNSDACGALLQNNAPFVLIRVLDRAGCPELLLGLLLGMDAPLPALSANQVLKPMSAHALHEVLHYLRQTKFPALVAMILESGARRANMRSSGARSGVQSSPPPRSPALRRSWQSPATPGALSSGWPSPNAFTSTPNRLRTPKAGGSPLLALAAPPSSPSPSSFMDLPMDLPPTALPHLMSQASVHSPDRSRSPVELRSHTFSPSMGGSSDRGSGGNSLLSPSMGSDGNHSGSEYCSPATILSGGTPSCNRTLSPSPGTPGSLGCGGPCTPANSCRRSTGHGWPSSAARSDCASSPGEEQTGVVVLIEFLTCLLDTAGRAWEQRFRSKDQDIEIRAELRLQLLQLIFVETALIPHLFQLLRSGVAQFESATLLRGLLTHSLTPQRCLASLVDPLLDKFLPQVELLCTLLLKNGPKTDAPSSASNVPTLSAARPERKLRLNAYTVREPLGALRVTAVQILAALSDLAPEQTLAAIKPAIWGLLVQWFFAQRCNHIFQASCGRLFIAVIQFGSMRLQQLVLVKLKLLTGICETVLTEGACGDRWHEQRPQTRAPTSFTTPCHEIGASVLPAAAGVRVEKLQVAKGIKRHPGGLGGITPVIAALAQVQKCAADEAAASAAYSVQKVWDDAPADEVGSPGNCQPLVPLADDKLAAKPTGHVPSFIARLLADNDNWLQVVKATSRTNLSDASVVGGA